MPPVKTPNTELIDYQFKVMNDRLESHQEYAKGEFQALHNKMDKFIESCNTNFATKDDHKLNKERIDAHDKLIGRLAWGSFVGFLSVIATTIGIDKLL